MVWGLFPSDPRSGDEKYYIYAKGTYKVGRKGCDVIISNDKGVSRIHAELIVDALESLNHLENESFGSSSKVRVRDCSKYGTFVGRSPSVKEKVCDLPGKETYVQVGDLISFGTGNATYRFCFVPLVFYLCNFTSSQLAPCTQDKVSSIGARVVDKCTTECTHVIVDPFMPVTEEIVDAVVSKKPLVVSSWLEMVAAKRICSELPGCSSYFPTLTLDDTSITVVDANTRENCLKGYTFILGSSDLYRFRDKMKLLLEVAGGEVLSVDEFDCSSQDVENDETCRKVLVLPSDSAKNFHLRSTLSKVNEINLLCAVLSGHFDPSILMSTSVVVSSSCSTDDTVVADSDAETETAASHRPTNIKEDEIVHDENERVNSGDHAGPLSEAARMPNIKQHTNRIVIKEQYKEAIKYEFGGKESVNDGASLSRNDQSMKFVELNRRAVRKEDDDSEVGTLDILYSQNLIVRDANMHAATGSVTKNGGVNFKRFRKTKTQSGNSFANLVPFSKYPYIDSGYDNETSEYVKEEKKRKQVEAMAEDLFNNERGRRRAVAGFLTGLLNRS